LTAIFDREKVGEWVKERIKCVDTWGNEYKAIGWERNGQLVCGVVYNHYSGNDIAMHVAGRGVWAKPEALKVFFAYPFEQLQCQRVTAYVASKNAKCLTLVDRLGFFPEGRLREGLPDDDLLIFGMLRRECRWLRGYYGKVIQRTVNT
jgi:RimJ/RimL family protein N-acetyltransferase